MEEHGGRLRVCRGEKNKSAAEYEVLILRWDLSLIAVQEVTRTIIELITGSVLMLTAHY